MLEIHTNFNQHYLLNYRNIAYIEWSEGISALFIYLTGINKPIVLNSDDMSYEQLTSLYEQIKENI